MNVRVSFLTILSVVTILSSRAPAAERIHVQVDDGRKFGGEIDARSDETALWLRRGDADAYVVRRIAWNDITSGWREDVKFEIADLKALALEVEQPAAPPLPKWRGVFAAIPAPNVNATAPTQHLRSLAIDSYHANWDADTVSDGIVIEILPQDEVGALVPVTGSLEVAVYAPEVRRFSDAPHGRGLTIEPIARWTVAVAPGDFDGVRGARYQLPYQAVDPHFDTNILPQGLVTARLVVPGEGTFDASDELIRLRAWSPLRDKLWRDTGTRYFPSERTGR